MQRNVLLTGGSRGIGMAIKDRFVQGGYTVEAPVRSELDLSDEQSINSFIKKHHRTEFDVIVNNAGINDINLLEDIDQIELDNMFQVNLKAPILLLRAFIPGMKKRNYGKIVNIGSIWAVVSKKGRGLYSAAKNGLHGITNALALELGEYNILVNTVCPGFTLTELTKKNNTQEEIRQTSDQIPLKRMAKPEEIAEFVYFLCSDNNTYITGQKICIDGGYTVQ
jgi:3-oxoacyl-[acyl-carrier protein] reductase